jgi:hypothetical protein
MHAHTRSYTSNHGAFAAKLQHRKGLIATAEAGGGHHGAQDIADAQRYTHPRAE